MISLYTGTPGAGKSYHMAETIYYDVKYGRPVVCNFDVNRDIWKDKGKSFYYVPNRILTPQNLAKISEAYFLDHQFKEGKIRLYIDECQIMFNARQWNDKGLVSAASRADWVKFFTQHRKLGYDIFLISQFDTMIDKQIRSLVEYEVKHRKLNNVGWVGKFFTFLLFGRPVFLAIHYWYPQKERLSCDWRFGRKKFYRMYDTSLVFDGALAPQKALSS